MQAWKTLERPAPWLVGLAGLTGVAVWVALGLVFFYAPSERTMGVVQKIFYLHVPSAIMAYAGFFLCCGASVVYLLRPSPKADVIARAGAEVGVLFCTVVLVTGPLWARKAWGTWWTGEPRLLLTLIMALIFVAYLLVRAVGGRREMTRKVCAVLAILGVADIPLVRLSVERWRGAHPQVISGEGAGISPEMQVALTASFVAWGLLFALFLVLRIRLGFGQEAVEEGYRLVQAREHAWEATLEKRA